MIKDAKVFQNNCRKCAGVQDTVWHGKLFNGNDGEFVLVARIKLH